MSSDAEILKIAKLFHESSKSANDHWIRYCRAQTENERKSAEERYRHHRAQCMAYAKALSITARALSPWNAIDQVKARTGEA